MRIDTKWHGESLLRKVVGVTPDGLYKAAEELLDTAKPKAPRASGTLQDSGYVANEERSTYKPDKQHKKEYTVPEGGALTGFAAFYAHMVENGTSKMAAQPFLRPALDQAKRRAGIKAVAKMRSKLR